MMHKDEFMKKQYYGKYSIYLIQYFLTIAYGLLIYVNTILTDNKNQSVQNQCSKLFFY